MAKMNSTPIPPRVIDISNQRFGRLIVIAYLGGRPTRWLCRCDCGIEKSIIGECLRDGSTKSCGCFRATRLGKYMTVHGKTHTPEYNSWRGMADRCNNPRNKAYPRYGGRGITICERWRSFGHFLADMGPRPADCSLDRIDNNGNYEPDNCRWASRKQQGRNKRNLHLITFNGETLTAGEWSERTDIQTTTIEARLRGGWTNEQTLIKPTRTYRKKSIEHN